MADERVPWSEVLTKQHASALTLVCLGVWLHAADGLIVATMMPAIIAEIGGGEFVAWSVALYEIGSIVAGATGGFLALRTGLRLPMSSAAFLFAVGCIVSALAPNMPVLLAGRLLQGLGGGGLMALSFVAVSVLFPHRLVARALASVSALWGASSFLGPVIGGFFVEYATWRLGFGFFALQAGILGVWIGLMRGLGEHPDTGGLSTSVPLTRLLLLAAGVVLIAYGGIRVDLMTTPAFIAAGLGCLVVFLIIDDRAGTHRLLPSLPFSLRSPHGSALTMIFLFSAATIAITAYGPLLVVTIHGASAIVAGYIVACSAVGWTVVAVVVSGSEERHDTRYIAAGMSFVLLSVFGFAYSVAAGPVWLIAAFAVMEGGGFGMAWTFILRRATALGPADQLERISGAIPTVQRLGYAVGAAYIGIVANAAGFASADSTAQFKHSAQWIFLGCLPLALFGFLAMLRFVSPIWRKAATSE